MSEENVEIVRQNYEQLNETGTPALDSLDSEVEFDSRGWRESALMPGSGPSRNGRTPSTPGRSSPVS